VTSKDNKPTQNVFQIMDEIVRQLNRTKKMFLIMIVSVVVVVPSTFIVTFTLLGGPSFWSGGPDGGGPPHESAFGIARGIVIAFLLAWIVIGIRQWFVLSKWTQRYEIYKELQKKIDEKLDYESKKENNNEEEEKEKRGRG
jgi:cell division protein FtsL